MRVDECGYELRGASAAGVARYDDAVRSLLLFRDDIGDEWEATVADDPAFTLGHVGRAYLRCLSSEAPDAAEARQIVDAIGVPRISAFYGIVIAMYFNDHAPPHFHARYAEHEAQVLIETAEILEGTLPRRALALVREWAELHQDELVADWARARAEQPLVTIVPLP